MQFENKELSLSDIHEATLQIIQFIHDFCDEHNLGYYLAYGSLLGAIRHKGYIPWDDDVDIWIFRDDYNKLIELFRNNSYQINNYRLCLRESVDNYSYPIARISDMNYKMLTDNPITPDMGTFVDIYPLDKVSSQEAFDITYKKISKFNRNYAVVCDPYYGNTLKRIIKMGLKSWLTIIYRNSYRDHIERKSQELLLKAGDVSSEYLGVLNWYTTGSIVYPKMYFDEKILCQFEDREFYIPKRYDELLTLIYGDYMTPPPENKRTQYHNYKIYRRELQ